MKRFIFILLVTSIQVTKVFSQDTTIFLNPDFDNALGYHLGYGTDVINYNSALQNAAFSSMASGTLNMNRAIIHFDFSFLQNPSQLISAKLNLYSSNNSAILYGHWGNSNATLLRRVTQPWVTDSVTWNNQPTVTDSNQVVLPSSNSSIQDYLNVDVTALVSKIINTNNYGIHLQLQNENPNNGLVFCSIEFPDSTKWPTLEITYKSKVNTQVQKVDSSSADSSFVYAINNFQGKKMTTFKTQKRCTLFELINSLGQVIAKGLIDENNIIRINSATLPKEIYFIRLLGNNNSETKKISTF